MGRNDTEDVRTPREGIKVANIAMLGDEPVAVIKHGKKHDMLTVNEFASELYGYDVECEVKPKQKV